MYGDLLGSYVKQVQGLNILFHSFSHFISPTFLTIEISKYIMFYLKALSQRTLSDTQTRHIIILEYVLSILSKQFLYFH